MRSTYEPPGNPRSLVLTALCWQEIRQEYRICRAAGRDIAGGLFGTATPRRIRARLFVRADHTAAADEGIRRARLLHLRPLGHVQSFMPDKSVAPYLRDLDFTTAPGDVILWVSNYPATPTVMAHLVVPPSARLQPIPVHIERPRRSAASEEQP